MLKGLNKYLQIIYLITIFSLILELKLFIDIYNLKFDFYSLIIIILTFVFGFLFWNLINQYLTNKSRKERALFLYKLVFVFILFIFLLKYFFGYFSELNIFIESQSILIFFPLSILIIYNLKILKISNMINYNNEYIIQFIFSFIFFYFSYTYKLILNYNQLNFNFSFEGFIPLIIFVLSSFVLLIKKRASI